MLHSDVLDASLPLATLEEILAMDADGCSGRFVYVSMGTRIPSQDPALCRAVYEAIFEELGASEGPPLLVLSLGPGKSLSAQGLSVPRNAICQASVPQQALLRLKPALFLTHCGQNSFMESLSAGIPMVACPADDDQPLNAARVEQHGVGVSVARKDLSSDLARQAYKAAVRAAVRKVMDAPERFAARAEEEARKLAYLDGPSRATDLMLRAASAKESLPQRIRSAAMSRLHEILSAAMSRLYGILRAAAILFGRDLPSN